MDIKEAMQKALELERKGMEFYTEIADHTENKFVKDVFSYLAAQEVFHEKEIQQYMTTSGVELGGAKPIEVKDFFGHEIETFKEDMKASEDDLHAYEKGMQLEKDAYNFYKVEFDETEDSEVKKFMKFLMEQENAHYELLRNGFEYLKDPSAYHMSEEDWGFEG